ncbi:MAG: hypothetical protein ABIK83_13040, partial [Candidatus Zixiibacteriota bacterium]
LEQAKRKHGHLNGELPSELSQIEIEFESGTVLADGIHAQVVPPGDEAKTQEYQAIFEKIRLLPAEVQCKVIEQNCPTVGMFLLSNLVDVSREMVEQLVSLRQANRKDGRPYEDRTTDLMRSLLRCHLGRFGWTFEPTRGGKSEDGDESGSKGVGERDAEARCYGQAEGLIEAFSLTSLDTKVIGEHFDKVPGYNAIGYGNIYFVVYVRCKAGFGELWTKYFDHMAEHEYEKYERIGDALDMTEHFSQLINVRVAAVEHFAEGLPVVVHHVFQNHGQ